MYQEFIILAVIIPHTAHQLFCSVTFVNFQLSSYTMDGMKVVLFHRSAEKSVRFAPTRKRVSQ